MTPDLEVGGLIAVAWVCAGGHDHVSYGKIVGRPGPKCGPWFEVALMGEAAPVLAHEAVLLPFPALADKGFAGLHFAIGRA